jgi:hypothetical protein
MRWLPTKSMTINWSLPSLLRRPRPSCCTKTTCDSGTEHDHPVDGRDVDALVEHVHHAGGVEAPPGEPVEAALAVAGVVPHLHLHVIPRFRGD